MPDSEIAESLRRRIALYRQYLKDGVDAEIAADYLKTIAADEATLARLKRNKTQ